MNSNQQKQQQQQRQIKQWIKLFGRIQNL